MCVRPMKQFREFEKRMCGLCSSSVFLVALFTLLTTLVFATPQSSSPAPDAIFIGQFLTLDPGHPRAEAIAVSAGRIVAVGSKAEVEGGLSKAEILTKVAEAVHSAPPGGWITGMGWDQGFWRPAVFPTAKELDTVSGDHPVILDRIDGHSTWVNSKVLALAKISSTTPDPQGGLIRRDAAGQPSGMLIDNAQELVSVVTPKPAHADRERHIRIALQQFTRWGLSSVHDAGTDLEIIAIYKDLLKRGELPVRVYAMARGNAAITHYLASGPETDLGNGMLAVRSFELVLDGVLGSRGDEMTEAYSDAPEEHGLQTVKDADLAQIVGAARKKGFQVNTHAIGHRAVTRALDAFEKNGVTREERFRVEHASVVTDGDVSRFARLGVIASLQPVLDCHFAM